MGKVLHDMSRSKEYFVWQAMKDRCLNKNNKRYSDYGGRGITVCDEWMDFNVFIKDMGEKPFESYSIDRKDNNKGYSKDNCRWVDKTTQVINRRVNKNNSSGYKGVGWSKAANKWSASITVNYKKKHLGLFNKKEDAVEARKKAEREYFTLAKKNVRAVA